MRAVRKMMTSDLQRVRAGFAGADAERLLDRGDEDLAVADLAGVGGLLDRLDRALDLAVVDHDLDLHLGQEADQVLGATIDLGLALLSAEAFDLADGQAGDTHAGQRVAHFVELERLDDGGHQLHALSPRSWRHTKSGPGERPKKMARQWSVGPRRDRRDTEATIGEPGGGTPARKIAGRYLVHRLAVEVDVEAFDLLFGRDAQANDGVDDLEDHEGGDRAPRHADEAAPELGEHLAGIAVDQALLAVASDGLDREHAGQERDRKSTRLN